MKYRIPQKMTGWKCVQAAITASALLVSTAVSAKTDKPNIVFILADDMGWKDLSCYGSSYYESPNIDKLAKSGIKFTDAYSPASLCSASRAAILTGWSPARQHLHGVTPHSRDAKFKKAFKDYKSWTDKPEFKQSKTGLSLAKQLGQLDPENSITIAERLKEKGYATASMGKWHLGPDEDKYPEKHGFDINIGGSHFGWPKSFFSPYKIPHLKDGPKGEYLTDRLTDESLKWIEEQHKQKKPFFLYLPHFAVHGPWESKKEYAKYFTEKKGNNKDINCSPNYAGMVKSLDDSVGRIVAKLKELGIEKNTLVVFTSDNGGIISKKKKGKVSYITSMKPLRGEKALAYEGGLRVPCIISMPGTVTKGKISDTPITGTDFYPTILDLVGLKKKKDNPLDGLSLLDYVTKGTKLDRDFITWFMPQMIQAGEGMGPNATIRYKNYKFFYFFDGTTALYDLSKDIGESKNIADSMPELCGKIKQMLMKDLDSKNAFYPKGSKL